ncbi:DUF2938 domain-containing protein [Ramlibacter sp. AW1]|uniref:DUF2938 domain-containing protein n=1 Tax=Ramlibacter aurantiacus TaxID=2801330 RepID=A0A937D408_9BURK|nr:DUF2938 domain-containing protein [Ramlibacter aurantiacus]MBL0419872.1 DUF2938 domain-containing protein [Ramlibacter aurantiacus]
MDPLVQDIARVALVGVGATATLDLWLLLQQRLGGPPLDFSPIGRWVGHWPRGVFRHVAIAKAEAIEGERTLGWSFHYATGLAFAALLVGLEGVEWTRSPTVLPALAIGIGTVLAPWLVMQPALGAGIAAARTPSPLKSRARSLANHAVFGLGLYLSALFIAWISR